MFDMNSSYLHVLNRICEEVHQEMSGKIEKEKTIEWTVNMEVLFLYAMIGHKPVGVNKHFMMLLIHNKFSSFINHEISSKALWDKLDTLYDMSALHESEIIPFPNEEEEFELPEEFHDLLHSKHSIALKKSNTESETSKNSTNISKSSKKVTPKLKQGTPASAAKNTFASPALNKPQKSQTGVKSDSKASTSDGTPKLKESGSSAKASKIKRSSSPFTSKSTKSESATASKEGSPDVSLPKKSNKLERGSSPAIIKKPAKADSTMNSSSKKPAKSESSTNGSKPAKTETSENPTKRDKKVDKDTANKKSKNTPSAEVSGKKPKLDAVGAKKRSESESSRKSVESSSSVKQVKADVKHSNQSNKGQEAENSTLSGSRKSSPVVKVKNNESNKKLKRPRVEEPSKRSTPAPKRRRQ